jgi:hypothetical protein
MGAFQFSKIINNYSGADASRIVWRDPHRLTAVVRHKNEELKSFNLEVPVLFFRLIPVLRAAGSRRLRTDSKWRG